MVDVINNMEIINNEAESCHQHYFIREGYGEFMQNAMNILEGLGYAFLVEYDPTVIRCRTRDVRFSISIGMTEIGSVSTYTICFTPRTRTLECEIAISDALHAFQDADLLLQDAHEDYCP